ncbi:MAG: sulfatase-like hydrolase/transferase, partial [Planctomycetaceae bacterium]|nr:sulfatase-like hydrolase/transferase [Planctomycetaceae bacterium]
TDYNFHWNTDDVWHESSGKAHWKNRPQQDQPFFAVFNLTMTHESRIWPGNWKGVVKDLPTDKRHRPENVVVPPLYPDTPEVRGAIARLHDIITVMDESVGKYLQELNEAGLENDTIVFFWSDHGDGFPRAKRWIYDTGTLVPMMVRIPKKFRVGGQGTPGSVSRDLVSLIDLGPTVLNLAGLPIPANMHGRPFLGQNLPDSRTYTYGARDRVDERLDMVRSVRDARYRYVRNYNPWRPALQHINYSERSVVRKEMRRLLAEGKLAPESAQFLTAPRPPEELYDLQVDPWELHNLAADPAHGEVLKRLSAECDRWQLSVRDAHLLPEILLDEEEQKVGSRRQILHAVGGDLRTQKLLQLAKLSRAPQANDESVLLQAAATDDPAQRWWAVTGLTALKSPSPAAQQAVTAAAADASVAVRIAAARGLHVLGSDAAALNVLTAALKQDDEFVRHAALVQLDEMGSAGQAAVPQVRELVEELRKSRRKLEYAGNVAAHLLGE